MKLAAHYTINEQGKATKGMALEILAQKLVRMIEMGNQIQELAQMEFHSGVLIPAFPNTSAHWAYLLTQKDQINTPPWLQLMPNRQSNSFYLEWILAMQNADDQFCLKDAVKIFCTELTQLLHLEDIKLQLDTPVSLWLISGVDYHNFRLNTASKLRQLL
ncbi:MAG: hypothetical protein ACK5JS_03875 [Mangrovibacterium sp.]